MRGAANVSGTLRVPISAHGVCGLLLLLSATAAHAQPADPEKSAAAMVTPAAQRAIDKAAGLAGRAAERRRHVRHRRLSRQRGHLRAVPAWPSWPAAARPAAAPTAEQVTAGRRLPPGQCPAERLHHRARARPAMARCTATASPRSFLAECYGMSPRAELREKLAKAVKLIVNTQNKEGGWRYNPQRDDADISVTVCQVMALRAAHNAGLFVPKETIDRAIEYVKRCQNADGGFMYMPSAGGESGFPRSAAAVVGLEQRRHLPRARKSAKALDYLMRFRPGRGRRPPRKLLRIRPLLRRAGDVARRRRPLGPLVSGHPRRTDRPAAARRLLDLRLSAPNTPRPCA